MRAKKRPGIVSKNRNDRNERAILYETFEKKNVLERKMASPLTPSESLIHTLDLMDFMAVFQAQQKQADTEEIDWIVLQFSKK